MDRDDDGESGAVVVPFRVSDAPSRHQLVAGRQFLIPGVSLRPPLKEEAEPLEVSNIERRSRSSELRVVPMGAFAFFLLALRPENKIEKDAGFRLALQTLRYLRYLEEQGEWGRALWFAYQVLSRITSLPGHDYTARHCRARTAKIEERFGEWNRQFVDQAFQDHLDYAPEKGVADYASLPTPAISLGPDLKLLDHESRAPEKLLEDAYPKPPETRRRKFVMDKELRGHLKKLEPQLLEDAYPKPPEATPRRLTDDPIFRSHMRDSTPRSLAEAYPKPPSPPLRSPVSRVDPELREHDLYLLGNGA